MVYIHKKTYNQTIQFKKRDFPVTLNSGLCSIRVIPTRIDTHTTIYKKGKITN